LFESITKHFKKSTETKASGYFQGLGDVSGNSLNELIVGGGNYNVTPHTAAQLYRQSSAIAIAVDTIAEEIEQIKPVLKIGDDFIDNHPVLDLLAQPNPDEYNDTFLGQLARDWLLNHDFYFGMTGNIRSEPISLYSVPPQYITVREGENLYPNYYIVYRGLFTGTFNRDQRGRERARYKEGNLKELAHCRGYSSRRTFTSGDSPINAILLEARQHIQGRYHNLKLLDNGGRLSLVAIFKDRLDNDEIQERREGLNEQLGGAHNAGKIATISADDMELMEFGTTNKDMDYANLDSVVFNTTMLRYKVPLPLVTNDASTFNNFSEAVFHLYDRAIIPNYKSVMNGLSRVLLPRFNIDVRNAELTFNPETIEPLKARRLDELAKRKEVGIETINELRTLLPNREPIGEEGDVVYQPATLTPVGQDLFTDDNYSSAEEQRRAQRGNNE